MPIHTPLHSWHRSTWSNYRDIKAAVNYPFRDLQRTYITAVTNVTIVCLLHHVCFKVLVKRTLVVILIVNMFHSLPQLPAVRCVHWCTAVILEMLPAVPAQTQPSLPAFNQRQKRHMLKWQSLATRWRDDKTPTSANDEFILLSDITFLFKFVDLIRKSLFMTKIQKQIFMF